MEFTDVINALTDVDRKIVRTFIMLRNGKREVEGREFLQYMKIADITARRDGPLKPILLIFGSGTVKFPVGGEARFEAFRNEFEANEQARRAG